MNKIDDACFVSKRLSPREYLSDEQAAEVRRRLADTGEATITPSELRARLTESVSSPPGKRTYARGWVSVEKGEYVVSPVGGSGSHLIASLAGAYARRMGTPTALAAS